jgi:hypothetical protein
MKIATILFLLLLPLTVFAAPPGKTLPESDPTYQVVRAVFDRLARVVGGVPPQLYLVKTTKPLKVVLGADPLIPVRVEQGKFIVMDEGLVAMTAELGSPGSRDNALAFLLGHELAHYAAKQSGGLAGDGRSEAENVKAEEFADRMGVWYAGEAGYEPFPAAEQILPKVYEKYHDNNPELKGYPKLNKRMAIISGVREQMIAKLPFLDAATTLLAISRPFEASRLFEHVARSYESRELLNNAAVAAALAALTLQPTPYFYPFELESAYRFPSRIKDGRNKGIERRLELESANSFSSHGDEYHLKSILPKTRTREVPSEQDEQRAALLTKSADLLDHALFIDNTYVTTQLNRAAVAELQGDRETMTYRLSLADKLAGTSADPQSQARIAILRGISLAKEGKRAEAAAAFTAARPRAEQMAITNLLAIDEDPKLPPPPFIPDDPVKETINGASPVTKRDSARIIAADPLLLDDEYGGNITIHRLTTAGWNGARLKMGKLIVTTITTPANFAAASKRGIRQGDSDSDVTGRYGRPNRTIATRQGNLLVYSQDSVIFTINREQKVLGWTIYSVQE